MNIKEMGELCEEAALLDAKFGARELIAAWVRVNIDDELYEQDEEGNTASELVYDEFSELVARIYYGREWQRLTIVERQTQQARAATAACDAAPDTDTTMRRVILCVARRWSSSSTAGSRSPSCRQRTARPRWSRRARRRPRIADRRR